MAAVFFVQVVLARGLGAPQYAVFVVAWSCTTLFGMLGMFGLNTLGCRYLAESLAIGDRRRAAATLITIGLVAVVTISASALLGGVFVGTLAGTLFTMPELSMLAIGVGVWIALLAATQLLAELCRGMHNLFAASMLSGVSGGLLSNGVLLVLLLTVSRYANLTLSTVVLLAAVALGLQLVVSVVALLLSWQAASKVVGAEPRGELAPLSVIGVIRESSPIMVVQAAGFGVAQLDVWLVGMLGSPQQLAAYAVARRLALLIAIPLNQVGQVISASISELYTRGDLNRLASVLKGAATVGVLISVPLALLLIVLGRTVLTTVFGHEYGMGAIALQLFCLGQIAFALTGPCGPTLLMTGHQRQVLWIMLSCATMFVHAPWVAACFGVNGMAALMALFVAANNLIQWRVVTKQIGLSTSPSFETAYLLRFFYGMARRSPIEVAS